MSENPDTIRTEIEATRARLGTNVDAVAEKVTPSNIVHRQSEKVKDAVFGVKEKVMGAADHATATIHTGTGNPLSGAGTAISDAPAQAKAKTQGNPLAAGLVAFGAGLLLSSLIPPSQKEREAADALKTAAEPLTTELAGTAKDMAQGLKNPAREAMENVKTTATDAAQHLKTESQDAATDISNRATDAKDHVQNT